MEAKRIDMKDYVLSGKGVTGNCYDSIQDKDMIVKLYDTVYPVEAIYAELEAAHKVYELGIPSPEPGEMVTDGTRLGLRFKKIHGKRSYSQCVHEEPERCEEFAREFARMNKQLHSMELPAGTFPDSKNLFRNTVRKNKFLTQTQKARINQYIDAIPDMNTALHGDLHMGNIVTTLPKGAPMSTPHSVYFIDLGYFSQGYPLIDLGINDVICNYLVDSLRLEHYHLTKPQTQEFWKYFVDEYFYGADCLANSYFGPSATRAKVEKELSILTALRFCQISHVMGKMEPEYEIIIRDAFGQ